MRVMVTGSAGMLGEAMIQAGELANYTMIPVPHTQADIRDHLMFRMLIRKEKPDVLINCAGLTPYRNQEQMKYFEVNSLAPLKLSRICETYDVRMVQVSTDCVFNGYEGAPYNEKSHEYHGDTYGMSKLLGELTAPHLTVRCSFIGLKSGLLRWLLNQSGDVPGYGNCRWNGMTVNRVAEEIIYQSTIETSGTLHIYGRDTTKYDILCDANKVFGLGLNIIKVEEPRIDRRLRTNRREFTMALPPIKDQMEELLCLSNQTI